MAENQVRVLRSSEFMKAWRGLTFFNPTPVNLSIFSQGLTEFSVFGRLQSAPEQAGPAEPARNYDVNGREEIQKLSDADYLLFSSEFASKPKVFTRFQM